MIFGRKSKSVDVYSQTIAANEQRSREQRAEHIESCRKHIEDFAVSFMGRVKDQPIQLPRNKGSRNSYVEIRFDDDDQVQIGNSELANETMVFTPLENCADDRLLNDVAKLIEIAESPDAFESEVVEVIDKSLKRLGSQQNNKPGGLFTQEQLDQAEGFESFIIQHEAEDRAKKALQAEQEPTTVTTSLINQPIDGSDYTISVTKTEVIEPVIKPNKEIKPLKNPVIRPFLVLPGYDESELSILQLEEMPDVPTLHIIRSKLSGAIEGCYMAKSETPNDPIGDGAVYNLLSEMDSLTRLSNLSALYTPLEKTIPEATDKKAARKQFRQAVTGVGVAATK